MGHQFHGREPWRTHRAQLDESSQVCEEASRSKAGDSKRRIEETLLDQQKLARALQFIVHISTDSHLVYLVSATNRRQHRQQLGDGVYMMMSIQMRWFHTEPYQILDLTTPLPKDGPEHWQRNPDFANRIALEAFVRIKNLCQVGLAPWAER